MEGYGIWCDYYSKGYMWPAAAAGNASDRRHVGVRR